MLNALLKYLGQGSDPVRNNERPVEQARPEDMRSMLHRILSRDSSAYGCCLVALLGLTAVLKVHACHTCLCRWITEGGAVSSPLSQYMVSGHVYLKPY